MKIQLPDGNRQTLDESLSVNEKLQVVEELSELWMPIIKRNWDSNSVRFFLDGLSNYLVWHKEPDATREDKEVMSRNKTNRQHRGRKDTLFSDLGAKDKELLFGEVLNDE